MARVTRRQFLLTAATAAAAAGPLAPARVLAQAAIKIGRLHAGAHLS